MAVHIWWHETFEHSWKQTPGWNNTAAGGLVSIGMGQYLCPACHWWYLCHTAEHCGRPRGRDKGPLPQHSSQDQSNHQQTMLGEGFLNLCTEGSMSKTWEWGRGGTLFSCFIGWIRSQEGDCSRILQSSGRQFSWGCPNHSTFYTQPRLHCPLCSLVLWYRWFCEHPPTPSSLEVLQIPAI